MNRINMTKYGFVRSPQNDFSDDSTRFTCYKIGRVVVSKATYEGEVFIAGRIDDGNLEYEEYSNLPHYRYLDTLNGVSISGLTDADLETLAQACIEYDKEYTQAESLIIFPTKTELENKLQAEHNQLVTDYNTCLNLCKDNLEKIIGMTNNYYKNKLFEILSELKRGVENSIPLVDDMVNTRASRYIMKRVVEESYQVENFKEILSRA